MKMILSVANATQNTRTNYENYIRPVFAHITDSINITNVEVLQGQASDERTQISVTYHDQPNTSEVDFRQLIIGAIALRGGLELESLETPPKKIQIPGMRRIDQSDNNVAQTYEIHPLFYTKLALSEEYRKRCTSPSIIKVTFELVQVGPDRYIPTGGLCIEKYHAASQSHYHPSAYQVFAKILHNDSDLRESIASDNVKSISFTLNANETSAIRVIHVDNQPNPKQSSSNNLKNMPA